MKCPKCGNTEGISSTLMGFMNVGKPCKDDNYATCHKCGHKGKAWEFGAPEIPPMKGTEDWSDKEIKQWYKDFADGKIEIGTKRGSGVVCKWWEEDTKKHAQQDSSIILPKE